MMPRSTRFANEDNGMLPWRGGKHADLPAASIVEPPLFSNWPRICHNRSSDIFFRRMNMYARHTNLILF